MKVEILFPELCSLFGDKGNILLLEKTFGKENVTKTSILETPKFLSESIDLIYLGAMSEKVQIQVLEKLLPIKDQLKSRIDEGMKALFTGNAMDLLGTRILEEDGSIIEGFGLFDFETKITRRPRLNCVLYGYYNDIPMVGHKTQFTQAYTNNHDNYLFKVEAGMGINKESMLEGFTYKGLIGTNMTGPFLVMNPGFASEYLGVKLPHQELLEETQAKRIADISKVDTVFY